MHKGASTERWISCTVLRFQVTFNFHSPCIPRAFYPPETFFHCFISWKIGIKGPTVQPIEWTVQLFLCSLVFICVRLNMVSCLTKDYFVYFRMAGMLYWPISIQSSLKCCIIYVISKWKRLLSLYNPCTLSISVFILTVLAKWVKVAYITIESAS